MAAVRGRRGRYEGDRTCGAALVTRVDLVKACASLCSAHKERENCRSLRGAPVIDMRGKSRSVCAVGHTLLQPLCVSVVWRIALTAAPVCFSSPPLPRLVPTCDNDSVSIVHFSVYLTCTPCLMLLHVSVVITLHISCRCRRRFMCRVCGSYAIAIVLTVFIIPYPKICMK